MCQTKVDAIKSLLAESSLPKSFRETDNVIKINVGEIGIKNLDVLYNVSRFGKVLIKRSGTGMVIIIKY